MNNNERIVAVYSHPSGLFEWPEWSDDKQRASYRLQLYRQIWERQIATCTGRPPDDEGMSDHEAHCLVEHDLRETLAGMGVQVFGPSAGPGEWWSATRRAEILDGAKRDYVTVDGYWVDNEIHQFATYLDALLSAAEAVLVEWDEAHKETGDAKV